jgi:hypothetical protein
MILWTGSLVLLAGDICPQPGPGATNTISEKVSLDVKSRGLKIAHLNIRSLPSKLDELAVRMTNSKSFDILTLSETWLNPDISEDEINISGYSCVRKDRVNGVGGGVAIYCHEGLNYSLRDDLHIGNISFLSTKFRYLANLLWDKLNHGHFRLGGGISGFFYLGGIPPSCSRKPRCNFFHSPISK